MSLFNTKSIQTSLTVGEQLVRRRNERRLTLAQAAVATNISVGYLRALETDRYAELPGEVYAKSFLKVYARHLELSAQRLIEQYVSEKIVCVNAGIAGQATEQHQPVTRIWWPQLMVTTKVVRAAVIGLVGVLCLAYLGFRVQAILTPPRLDIFEPQDRIVVTNPVTTIRGQVEQEATVTINGQSVLADAAGNFTETVVLRPGVNLLEVTATKNHGKQTNMYRTVTVTQLIK